MTTSMMAAIRTAAATNGYVVHSSRQVKIGTNELVIILDDINVEVLDNLTYRCINWVLIEWDTSVPDNVGTQIVTLAQKIENYVMYHSDATSRRTFKFISSEVNQLGLMYRISIIIEYVDTISIVTT